jgi:hypothetical protein
LGTYDENLADNDENMYHGERSLLLVVEKIVWDGRAILKKWISTPSPS